MQPRPFLLLALLPILAGEALAVPTPLAADVLEARAASADAKVRFLSVELDALESEARLTAARAGEAASAGAFLAQVEVQEQQARARLQIAYEKALMAAWKTRDFTAAGLAADWGGQAQAAQRRLARTQSVAALASESTQSLARLQEELEQRRRRLDDDRIEIAAKSAAERAKAEKSRQMAYLKNNPRDKNSLPLPAAGKLVQKFSPKSKGIVIQSAAGAAIKAPCASRVAYVGALRSYGPVLILETAGGYSLILAGMHSISASMGQKLAGGEIVGRLGGPADGLAPRTGRLYFEVQRAGESIDPMRLGRAEVVKAPKVAIRSGGERQFASSGTRREW